MIWAGLYVYSCTWLFVALGICTFRSNIEPCFPIPRPH